MLIHGVKVNLMKNFDVKMIKFKKMNLLYSISCCLTYIFLEFKFSDTIPKDEYPTENDGARLYDEHIPTSLLQKTLLTVGASVLSITDPFRHGNFYFYY